MSTSLQDSNDTPLQALQSISQLLHLTHHRNKNQHRLAKWYKAFSVLRRQVGKLVNEVETLERVVKFSSTGGEDGKAGRKGRKEEGEREDGKGREESKYVLAAREKVEERVEFMEEWVVPKCYLAFSNLIADNQYASLGLMLMATLARVQTLLKTLGKESESPSQSENGDVNVGPASLRKEKPEAAEDALEIDLGEVVSREAILEAEEDDGVESGKLKKKKKKKRRDEEIADSADGDGATSATAKRPKKKRKKGDAFDDLFAGLI
ncbi:hypothetical protein VTL71DRAFT_15975 [Oculimacula yallundae]|uniref:RNase MRP protein 1 RNA binding domain-containing protein n=1 Tax=Oculimacula yallundae TaxID=86028 RepID=A0ABR4CED6_9HELO